MEREEFEVIDNCLMVRLPEEIDHHQSGRYQSESGLVYCKEECR